MIPPAAKGQDAMKPWIFPALVVVAGAWLLMACATGSEAAVRKTVEEAAQAMEEGLNLRNLDRVQPFFATAAEGANMAGLAETWGTLQAFAGSLTASDRVQVHSFDVQEVFVHEEGNLARATYRLHLSVLRGSQVVFGFVATQNLALLRTGRGWRISGGDQAQLDEVVGQWPLPGSAAANP
jgi:hypothetical protein